MCVCGWVDATTTLLRLEGGYTSPTTENLIKPLKTYNPSHQVDHMTCPFDFMFVTSGSWLRLYIPMGDSFKYFAKNFASFSVSVAANADGSVCEGGTASSNIELGREEAQRSSSSSCSASVLVTAQSNENLIEKRQNSGVDWWWWTPFSQIQAALSESYIHVRFISPTRELG